jgi:CHAT domain-containing protein
VQRIRGDRAENLELAIKAFEAALNVYGREAFSENWAATQHGLGTAYLFRMRGDGAQNVELAIKAFEAALTVRTRQTLPQEWASTQIHLGLAYSDRVNGDRAENLELAIKAYEAALTVRTRALPEDWAKVQNNLGLAYSDRVNGDRAENLELAIKAYEAALTVRTRAAFPQDWAMTQHNLGNAYFERINGDRAENLTLAFKAYEAALTVYTRAAFPEDWAQMNHELGQAYSASAELADLWIKAYRAKFGAREGSQRTLEAFYSGRAEAQESAIKAYEAALTVLTREAFPRDQLMTARLLGETQLSKRDWRAADQAFAGARDAFLILFGQGLDEAEARDLIEKAGPLFAEAALAAAQMGQAERALDLLNEGKARLMAVALRQQSLDLTSEQKARHETLRAEIREWTRRAKTAKGTEGSEALRRLTALRQELLSLVVSTTAKNAPNSEALALARSIAPRAGAIIAPIVTKFGAKMLIVTGDGAPVSLLDLPDLTSGALEEMMQGGGGRASWLGEDRQADASRWLTSIDEVGPKLWQLFLGRVAAALQEHGVKSGARLIWMPAGALGLLPLGLAQDPATGRRFGDDYEIVTAPSLEALAASSRRIAEVFQPSLAEAVNPTGDLRGYDLPFAEIEGKLVAAHFSGKLETTLDRSNASPEAVLAALKDRSYWHFSSHGAFDWNDARHSGLMMKGGKTLTVGALLDDEQSLGRPRLVVLSACDSGVYDADRSPDEFVGLPSTFMQLGAAGVVSTLWKVDDLATALFMAKFYDLHLDAGLLPATALKQAQAWLREAARTELINYGKAAAAKAKIDGKQFAPLESKLASRLRSPDTHFDEIANALQDKTSLPASAGRKVEVDDQTLQTRPFAHPYYWGGFIYTGL